MKFRILDTGLLDGVGKVRGVVKWWRDGGVMTIQLEASDFPEEAVITDLLQACRIFDAATGPGNEQHTAAGGDRGEPH
jgi:hypothetical protein